MTKGLALHTRHLRSLLRGLHFLAEGGRLVYVDIHSETLVWTLPPSPLVNVVVSHLYTFQGFGIRCTVEMKAGSRGPFQSLHAADVVHIA